MPEPIDWTPPSAPRPRPKAAFHNNIALMRNHIHQLERENRQQRRTMDGVRELANSLLTSMPHEIASDPESVGRYIKDLLNE